MKTAAVLFAMLLAGVGAGAAELPVSSKEPVTVEVPTEWKLSKDRPPTPEFPFETYRVAAPESRNAACMITVFAKNRPEFSRPSLLQNMVKGDSRPYVGAPLDVAKIELTELKIPGGLGFCANFTDPDLVGKPVEKGNYKTATPVIVSLGTNYIIKATVLCDEIDGPDYKAAIKVVESLKFKKE